MTESKSKKTVWNKQDESRYNSLYNKLKASGDDINKEDYLKKYNKSKLQKIINKLELSTSTKEGFYFMVSKWLKLNDPTNTMISNFTSKGYDLMMKRSKEYDENELSEKKQKNYRDYSYFVDILNQINYKEIKTYRSHLQYLLLSLLIKQPPVRTSFYTSAEFHTKGGYDEKKNYIMLMTTGTGKRRVMYYVGKDKVTGSKSFSDILKNNIEVEDKELIELMYYSFEKYPRTYVLENRGKPIQDETLLRYLREITKVDNIDIDTMRSVYISHFYNNFNMKYAEKRELARKMRHDPQTAQQKYLLVLSKTKTDKAKDDRIKELEKMNKELNDKVAQLEKQLEDTEIKLRDTKGEASQSSEWKKKRYDIIYRLNKGINKNVKEKTLEKYDIQYNSDKNEYY